MIKPHKYMNLETSIINLTAKIIEILQNNSDITLERLRNIIEMYSSNTSNFIYSLDFLFLFNKIEYDIKTDIVRLIYETN